MKKKLITALVTLVMCGRLLTPIVATADGAGIDTAYRFAYSQECQSETGQRFQIDLTLDERGVVRIVFSGLANSGVLMNECGKIAWNNDDMKLISATCPLTSNSSYSRSIITCIPENGIQTSLIRVAWAGEAYYCYFKNFFTIELQMLHPQDQVNLSICDKNVCINPEQTTSAQRLEQRIAALEAQLLAGPGDVDGDGEITVMDAQYTLKYYTCNTVAGMNLTWDQILGREAIRSTDSISDSPTASASDTPTTAPDALKHSVNWGAY